MQISDQLAEALARFAYVHAHRAEVTEADRTKAAAELAERIHQDGRLLSMARAERVRRYGWHPPDL
jgi:hypothetical protein